MTSIRNISVCVAGLALATAGCTSPAASAAAPAPTVITQARTVEAVTAAAREAFDRYTSGDFAGAWESYTAAGRAAVSEPDYIRLNNACPLLRDQRVKIAAVRVEGDQATVRTQNSDLVYSYTMTYQAGRWLLEPTVEALADYKRGIDTTIAARKADGMC